MSNSNCCDNLIDHENSDRLLNESTTVDGTSHAHNVSMMWHERTPIARSVMDELSNDIDEWIAYQCQLNHGTNFYSETYFLFPETHPRINESVSNYEEMLNNEIERATNAVQADHENLLFQLNIFLRLNPISNDILSGTQNAQMHTMVLPIIHASDQYFNINHEDGHRNEDATTYIGPNDFINVAIDEIVDGDWIIMEENITVTTGID